MSSETAESVRCAYCRRGALHAKCTDNAPGQTPEQEAATCPQCGSKNVDRDAVDVGVGTQYGPLGCFDCGWSESCGLPTEEELP